MNKTAFMLNQPRIKMRSPRKERAAVAVVVAAALVPLLGFAAFAVDFAHAFVVRNEIQNGADAAALVGAACLLPRSDCDNTGVTSPSWDKGKLRAQNFLGQNKAENSALSTATIDAGYWNLSSRTLTTVPAGTGWVPTADDVPAIRVTVNKQAGTNNGGAQVFMAKIFGVGEIPLQARAVAIISSPRGANPGSLTPFVLSKCLYDQYWDSAKSEPRVAPTNPAPITVSNSSNQSLQISQVAGQPYFFPAVSTYSIQGTSCDTGQWTSFKVTSNAASYIRGLATTGNPDSLSINDSSYISTGNMASVYQDINACSAAGNKKCEYSFVPVVDDSSLVNTFRPIQAFACVRILSADWNGSIKHIRMQMSADKSKCVLSGTPGGPLNYGAIIPPRLAL